MSTHPNVILMCVLKPDTPHLAYRDILDGAEYKYAKADDRDIVIGGKEYSHRIMDSDYDESWQIGADEGSIVVFRLITYGYGESVSLADLQASAADLEEWARGICERHHCTYEIRVGANYW